MTAFRRKKTRAPLGELITLGYLVAIALALALAYALRFDFAVPAARIHQMLDAIALAAVVKPILFWCLDAHRGPWRFAGLEDFLRVAKANLLGSLAFTVVSLVVIGASFPRAIFLTDFLVCLSFTVSFRFSVRVYREVISPETQAKTTKGVLIYGAGGAGVMLLREFRSNPKLGRVLGFVDDDRTKGGMKIMGVPVRGNGRAIPQVVHRFKRSRVKVDEVIIAMPSATGRQMQEALANCRSAGVPCRTVPGLAELLTGKVLSAQIREIAVTDVLGREPVQLEEDRIRQHIAGKCVLVTGAAGSIGSELCRQIARFGPTKLIALDQAESDLFKIDLELRERFSGLNLIPTIVDIRNFARVDEVIRHQRVESIFHAAAYKHVPLMEAHACQAIQNNVFGTWNVARAASMNQVANFLMISSDKAVNPTNVMGTTKRVAELIVGAMQNAPRNSTKFVSVRFGNVLGSNGSVLPIFQKQIAAGGPVTITHPEIRRYFMTIPEAVQLVLQASTMGEGGEVFVLEMGDPVKIVDLARNAIRLAGLVPDEDIEIRFVGLRPGEKLFEELITAGENIMPTYHEKIKIFKGPGVSHALIESWLGTTEQFIETNDPEAAVAQLRTLVPEFKSDRWGTSPQARELAAISPTAA